MEVLQDMNLKDGFKAENSGRERLFLVNRGNQGCLPLFWKRTGIETLLKKLS